MLGGVIFKVYMWSFKAVNDGWKKTYVFIKYFRTFMIENQNVSYK